MNTDIVVALIAAGVSLAAAGLAYWRAYSADLNTALVTRRLEHANDLSINRYEKLYDAYTEGLELLTDEPILRAQDRDSLKNFLAGGIEHKVRVEKWLDKVRPILPENLLRELDDRHETVAHLNDQLLDAVTDQTQDRSADWWPQVEDLHAARLGYTRAVVDAITREIRQLAIPPT